MNFRKITQYLIMATLAIWLVWDIIAQLLGGTQATESGSVRDYAIYPVVPMFIGGLAGHFMFHEIRLAGAWGMWAAIGCVLLAGLWSALVKNDMGPGWLAGVHAFASKHPIVVFYIATVLGGVFWGLPPSDKTLA